MNCERVRELMSAYYDRELTPDLETEVREHLERCPDCVEQLAQFKELSKLGRRHAAAGSPSGNVVVDQRFAE